MTLSKVAISERSDRRAWKGFRNDDPARQKKRGGRQADGGSAGRGEERACLMYHFCRTRLPVAPRSRKTCRRKARGLTATRSVDPTGHFGSHPPRPYEQVVSRSAKFQCRPPPFIQPEREKMRRKGGPASIRRALREGKKATTKT